MPITLNCPCGKTLRVADEYAGKRTRCPACQAVSTVPQPEVMFEVVEDDPKQQLAPVPAPAKPTPKPAGPRDEDDEDEDARGYSVAKSKRDDDADEPKPKKKPNFRKRSRRDDEDDDYDHDERPRKKRAGSRSRGPSDPDAAKKILYVIGGLLMIGLGGVFLYFGVEGEGRRPIRAIVFGICFIVGGLGTMVKGATGNFEDDE